MSIGPSYYGPQPGDFESPDNGTFYDEPACGSCGMVGHDDRRCPQQAADDGCRILDRTLPALDTSACSSAAQEEVERLMMPRSSAYLDAIDHDRGWGG